VIYEEIPTPFVGSTYKYTFYFGKTFPDYHWAVYLGGAILLLCVNTVFFGTYWMLIVGYKMLKRDVAYVISCSDGDTNFALDVDEGLEDISDFLSEIERSNSEWETTLTKKRTGETESETAKPVPTFRDLDAMQAMSLGESVRMSVAKPKLKKNFTMYHSKDGWHVEKFYSNDEVGKVNICSAMNSIFFPFENSKLSSRTIYRDCLVVNPFQASAFPAIYIVFTLAGVTILLIVVFLGFLALLFLILNLALIKPLFPDGYPLTRDWLLDTVLIFFLSIYIVSIIANRYLMPEEGEWKRRIKCYQGVVLLDMFYLLTWGMLKAWVILGKTVTIDVVTWGFARMAIWEPTIRPPFQLLDDKYAAYVSVVRAAMIAHRAKKNPRILLSSTLIRRQVANTTIGKEITGGMLKDRNASDPVVELIGPQTLFK